MLRSAKKVIGYGIQATDGKIGNVVDLTVGARDWRIRHVIVDTGNWLPGARVLLSTESMEPPDWWSGKLPVQLDRDQVRAAPGLGADVADITTPAQLGNLHAHFGWSTFWPAGPVINPGVYEREVVAPSVKETVRNESARVAYTVAEISGYDVRARDGEIGDVKDLIMEDEDWKVRYLVVGTGKWLPGKKVLLSTDWIEMCDWGESSVLVDVARASVKECPEFDPSEPVNRRVEERLYDFHGRPRYWEKSRETEQVE